MQQSQGAKSVNVFAHGGKYDLYFVYAKADTAQTYTMYLGTGEAADYGTKHVKFGYVDIDTAKYEFSDAKNKRQDPIWPAKWVRNYDPVSGILTISVDMSSIASDFDLTQNDPKSNPPVQVGAELCQPKTMCGWTSNKCQCSITDTSNYRFMTSVTRRMPPATTPSAVGR